MNRTRLLTTKSPWRIAACVLTGLLVLSLWPGSALAQKKILRPIETLPLVTLPDGSTTLKCGNHSESLDRAKELEEIRQELVASGKSMPYISYPVTIDIVWHAVYGNNGDGELTLAQVDQQIAVLNAAYGPGTNPTQVQFNLKRFETYWDPFWADLDIGDMSEDFFMKSALVDEFDDPSARTLHIFSANSITYHDGNDAISLLGISTFPWGPDANTFMDGIMLRSDSLPYSPDWEGDTLVHEIGHYVGLYHTFESHGQASGCEPPGDYCWDTPDEATPNYDFCDPTRDTCTLYDFDPDPIHNYMDYSPDYCMYEFTPDQIAFMHFYLENYRSGHFPDAYTIAGRITNAGGVGVGDVVMTGLTGTDGVSTARTNSSGYYTGIVSEGASLTVRPVRAGFSFSPATRSYTNVQEDWLNQNYTSVGSVAISGHVFGTEVGAWGLPGAAIYVDGVSTTTTDANGFYQVSVAEGWSGTVSARMSLMDFLPASRSYTNVLTPQTDEDYWRDWGLSLPVQTDFFTMTDDRGNGTSYWTRCPLEDSPPVPDTVILVDFDDAYMSTDIPAEDLRIKWQYDTDEGGGLNTTYRYADTPATAANGYVVRFEFPNPSIGQMCQPIIFQFEYNRPIQHGIPKWQFYIFQRTGFADADLNSDNYVNLVDLSLFAQYYGYCEGDGVPIDPCANLVPSSSTTRICIDLSDFAVFASHYGHASAKSAAQNIAGYLDTPTLTATRAKADGRQEFGLRLSLEEPMAWSVISAQLQIEGLEPGSEPVWQPARAFEHSSVLVPSVHGHPGEYTLLVFETGGLPDDVFELGAIGTRGAEKSGKDVTIEVLAIEGLDDTARGRVDDDLARQAVEQGSVRMINQGNNPFRGSTSFQLSLPRSVQVSANVYNIRGQKVRTITNESLSAGPQTLRWDGRDNRGVKVAGGVYFLRVKAGQYTNTEKLILLR